jgi:hypothetical protein
MRDFIKSLLDDKLLEAKDSLFARIGELVEQKRQQAKLNLTAEMYEEVHADVDIVDELDEANVSRQGRKKVIRVRIRGGKVQRRVQKSAVPGYTIRGGKVVRMSSAERRHRKMAARRAKFKRRAKMKQAIRKRQRSLRKRKAMGIRG